MQQEELTPRITVEREVDWLRVKDKVNKELTQSLEDRIRTLPPDAQARLRPQLEKEMEAIRERMWEMTKPNLRVNGFNYEEYVESEHLGHTRADDSHGAVRRGARPHALVIEFGAR